MNDSIHIRVSLFSNVPTRTDDGFHRFETVFLNPLLQACAPPPLSTHEWEVTRHRYIPYKVFGEGGRAECFGADLILRHTCKSAHQAFLVAQAIRSVTDLFQSSHEGIYCFCCIYSKFIHFKFLNLSIDSSQTTACLPYNLGYISTCWGIYLGHNTCLVIQELFALLAIIWCHLAVPVTLTAQHFGIAHLLTFYGAVDFLFQSVCPHHVPGAAAFSGIP